MDATPQEPVLTSRVWTYLILLAVLPFFGLQFGVGNQIEQFSIISRLLDPGFAPNDFFLDSAAAPGQPRYYYSLFVAALTRIAPLAVVIHVLMLISGVVLGVSTYMAARLLLKAGEIGAALAATLVLLNHGFSIGNAGYLMFSNFQPASIAISTSIAGLLLLTLGRVWAATALFLFAALMHPTIGAEIAVISYASVFISNLVTGNRARSVPVVLSGVAFLVGLAAFWALPKLGGAETEKLSDAEFFSILMEFRAPHHYLGLDFLKRRWLEFILFLAAIGWMLIAARRSGLPARNLTILAALTGCVLGLCLLSLYFVDIAESRIWATAQLFRMVLVVKWVGCLLIGWTAARWLQTKQPSDLILVGIMILPAADALSYAVVAALATRLAITYFQLRGWAAVLATLPALLIAVDHHRDYGNDLQSLQIAFACLTLFALHLAPRPVGALAAIALVAGFLGFGHTSAARALLSGEKLPSAYTLSERQGDRIHIALLAREIGAPDAMWFVPPRLEPFRFVAGRAVVVDFTSIPFEDEGLREWRKRITTMFGETDRKGFGALRDMTEFHKLTPAIDLARDRYGAEYAVLYKETPWTGEVLAEAGRFKAVRLAP